MYISQELLPILLWMHKVLSKQRFIAASHLCTTKPVSSIITKCLKLIQSAHRVVNGLTYSGYNLMLIIDNSMEVHKLLTKSKNVNRKPRNVITYDFSTLYTSIPHDKLKDRIKFLVEKAFKGMNKKFICVTKYKAQWCNVKKPNGYYLEFHTLIDLIFWLIDNTYVMVGNQVLQQTIGIPMGTDCAPFLANLFLFSYEFEFLYARLKAKDFTTLNKFRRCARYIDDLFLVNNDKLLNQCKYNIYPKELELTSDDKDDQQVHYLDLDILITGPGFSYSIYDKRDNFNFPIVNFPDLSGNIPARQSYGVFIAQLVRFARGCLHFSDFQRRVQALTTKLLSQNFRLHKLQAAYVKFCHRHNKLIFRYGHKALIWRLD